MPTQQPGPCARLPDHSPVTIAGTLERGGFVVFRAAFKVELLPESGELAVEHDHGLTLGVDYTVYADNVGLSVREGAKQNSPKLGEYPPEQTKACAQFGSQHCEKGEQDSIQEDLHRLQGSSGWLHVRWR